MIVGVFFAALLGYALWSRTLDRIGVTPHIVMVVAGLGLGITVQGTEGLLFDTELLRIAGEFALILALAVDAARIDIAALRRTSGLPLRLLGIGLPLTIVAGTAVAVLVLPGIALLDAVIIATLLAPTDAALGAMVVNSRLVPLRIRQALNVESGLNDGLVTPIVLVAVALAGARDATTDPSWVADAVAQIGLGALAGGLVGAVAGWSLRLALGRTWMQAGATWIVVPAVAMLAWFVAHELGGNVFIAAFVAGLALTAAYGRVPEALLEFAEAGGELLGLGVFFLFGTVLAGLGAALSLPALLYAALSLTLIRMLPVAIALRGADLRGPTVAFIGWFGPRGLASIVLTLVALGDGRAIPPFGTEIVAPVALTIALSVIAHGLSAGPITSRYGAYVATLPDDALEHQETAELPTRRGIERHLDAQSRVGTT
jgi:NhaP-type Na+/H+ or K+/H+ antiporter